MIYEISGFTIEYEVSGGFAPATWDYYGGSPAEYPEIDIVAILDDANEVVTLESFEEATGMDRHDLLRAIEKRLEEDMQP